MSSFTERKKKKRNTKYANILRKDFGIRACEEPTRTIMVCNAGLLTGISEADLVSYFNSFGKLERVCMIPGKSYAFVSFDTLNSAITCFSTAPENGSILGPLHLIYVENTPEEGVFNKDYETIPNGLIIVKDLISEKEEALLSSILRLSDEDSDQVMKHRSVKHFGFKFNYDTNNVDKNSPLSEMIPSECDFLNKRFEEKGLRSIIAWVPDQLTVNSYLPGQGIPPHVDTHSAFEDPILSISLQSDIVMEFEKCDKTKKCSILIPRRSLLIMSGEARYFWTHGITPRKSDIYMSTSGLCVKQREHRISYTFRKIRDGECTCSYPSVCDSFIKKNMKVPSDQQASKIEDEYVHKVYETISDHFSLTRHSPWPKVRDFIKLLSPGSVLVDIGCGNGKYFNINKNIFHFGGDTCSKLNIICKEHGEVLRFNCLSLPFCDNVADAVICIAVLHHLSNEGRREQAIKEIFRILRPGGKALIYVWAMEQKSTHYISKKSTNGEDSNAFDENYDGVPSVAFLGENEVLPIHSNRTQFKHNDLLVPWNIRLKDTKEACHLRYYHVFKEKELDEMCLQFGAEVVNSYYDDGNWCLEMKKPDS